MVLRNVTVQAVFRIVSAVIIPKPPVVQNGIKLVKFDFDRRSFGQNRLFRLAIKEE